MVVVPGGSFWMGTGDEDDKFASLVEKPRHLVEIGRPFAVGRFPVTFEEWDVFADLNAGRIGRLIGDGDGENCRCLM